MLRFFTSRQLPFHEVWIDEDEFVKGGEPSDDRDFKRRLPWDVARRSGTEASAIGRAPAPADFAVAGVLVATNLSMESRFVSGHGSASLKPCPDTNLRIVCFANSFACIYAVSTSAKWATALVTSRIPLVMAALQIVRGTFPLPADVEEQFRRAYGREMNEVERKFYGLESESTSRHLERQLPKAA